MVDVSGCDLREGKRTKDLTYPNGRTKIGLLQYIRLKRVRGEFSGAEHFSQLFVKMKHSATGNAKQKCNRIASS